MAITLHWIDENWNLKKLGSSFFEIEGAHTGVNLCSGFVTNLEKLGILGKVFSCVSILFLYHLILKCILCFTDINNND